MTTNAIIEEVRDALASNADITAWCVENFGRAQTVYVGLDMDSDDPVPDEHYPAIVVVWWRTRKANSGATVGVQFRLAVGVLQEAVVGTDNKISYQGMFDAETFMDLVSAALRSGFGHVEFDGEAGVIATFPYFENFNDITITNVKPRRRPS